MVGFRLFSEVSGIAREQPQASQAEQHNEELTHSHTLFHTHSHTQLCTHTLTQSHTHTQVHHAQLLACSATVAGPRSL